MSYYEYTQNNSGGEFVFEKDKLSHIVIIEAEDVYEANNKAESIGVYFNGVEDGPDCPCCGDRWYQPDELKFPVKWGDGVLVDLDQYINELLNGYWTWMREYEAEVYVHYKDGRVVGYPTKKKESLES